MSAMQSCLSLPLSAVAGQGRSGDEGERQPEKKRKAQMGSREDEDRDFETTFSVEID